MSLEWLRFFGTSVNWEERKKLDCAPRNSSPGPNILLHNYVWSEIGKMMLFPTNMQTMEIKHKKSGKQKYLRFVGFWTRSRINFLDDEKALKKEKSKLIITHLYFKMNIFFCASLLNLFFYSTQFSRSEIWRSPLFHLRPWKDHLRSFRCSLWKLQS